MSEDLPIVKSVKAILEGDDNFWAMKKAQPLLDRLEWAAFKMCQRGHYEDFASDAMTEAKSRIETLEAALRKIGEGDVCVSLMTHPAQCGRAYQARAALEGEKKDGQSQN